MAFDIGNGKETFLAYVQPDVATFYQKPIGSISKRQPNFRGFGGKFYNLSPITLLLSWDSGIRDQDYIIAYVEPFSAVGTATFPGHEFYFHELSSKTELIRFLVTNTTSHYVYDPYDNSSLYNANAWDVDSLNPDQRPLYDKQKNNILFSEIYREFTGRDYHGLYPRRVPMHHMWRADYFGQTHEVMTRETHFVKLPPDEALYNNNPKLSQKKFDNKQLDEYRHPQSYLSLTLTVISCAPRAFEIPNFLSSVEIQHVLSLANSLTFRRSTVQGDSSSSNDGSETETRTSLNSWINRDASPIIDVIYRRIAHLLKIDEALLRHRTDEDDEKFRSWPSRESVSEAFQLVHYENGQEYTAHHDWGYPAVDSKYQPTRFATVLLYLNDGMMGGHTSFPRWVNAETNEELKVTPEMGKAALFYSMLPDGNMDDLSQHAALPVVRGEKWLMNLWVWDPICG